MKNNTHETKDTLTNADISKEINLHLAVQLNIHKLLGETSYLIGIGFGFLSLLLGLTGSIIFFGVTRGDSAWWVLGALGLLYCIYISCLARTIKKKSAQRDEEFKKLLPNYFKEKSTDTKD